MSQIKESFTNFFSKTKSNLFTKINKSKMFDQQFKWNLINFIITCASLVAAITTIVTTTSSTDKSIALGLVYGFYLPFALANCILSVIVALCYIKKEPQMFWKKWYYYMPLGIILIEAIILPIPLNLVTRVTVNAGMMWTIIIFAFLAVFAAFASFIWVYKTTLTDQSYVLENQPEEDNLNDSEKNESKVKEDDSEDLKQSKTDKKESNSNNTITLNPVKEQKITEQPIEEALTLPYIGEIKKSDPDLTNQYDEVNNLETDVSHEDKKDETSSHDISNEDDKKSDNYDNSTF